MILMKQKYKDVTFEQIELMKHAIGFNEACFKGLIRGQIERRYKPFKNALLIRYEDERLKHLVEIGLMKVDDNVYSITDDGKIFLGWVTGVEILEDE